VSKIIVSNKLFAALEERRLSSNDAQTREWSCLPWPRVLVADQGVRRDHKSPAAVHPAQNFFDDTYWQIFDTGQNQDFSFLQIARKYLFLSRYPDVKTSRLRRIICAAKLR